MYQKPVSAKTGEICKGSLLYALFELCRKQLNITLKFSPIDIQKQKYKIIET